ncbi:hypothetical protein F0562_020070 [Nyssa sinensis]|uniref:ABC transporter domain-containing protein n=1 Tax=Nyssa sinensis TaxID=561372 RepID=A0A5J5BRP1_9ASTE|nr:hypothetical protein F0562_020070 [Nyssa sinensis]
MPNNSLSSLPTSPVWAADHDTPMAGTYSPRPSSVSGYSASTDSVITLPTQGAETPIRWAMVPGMSGGSTPEFRNKIDNASPETARHVALRMYESLKRNGLRDEVVRFSGIKYSRKFEIPSNGYETFGNKVEGCFTGPFKTLFQRKNSTWVQILKGVDGYVMPGSMTLLLGPPGCGKSTLLEILAGRVEENKNSNLQGVVMYNEKDASEIHLSRLIAYISGQLNKHIPFLSVRETLEFARDCTQGLRPENFTPQMRKFFAHALQFSDTDRQKLTTAELALGTYSVMLYDQPFSGFDLAATYDLVDTIRTISRIQQSSAIMSLTQLSQEVFDLFDRIILLGDGQVLFQGPRQDAIPYFANLGILVPEATPLTIDKLVECYRASDHFKDIMRIVDGDDVKHTYWEDEYQAQWEQFQRPFVQTWWKSTKTLIKRQIKITKRLHSLLKLRLFQAIVLGLFAGTLFYKLGGQYTQNQMNSVRALGLSLTGNGAPFFEYLLLLFLVAYFGSSVFFFLSAISSIPEVGNALAGLLVSVFLLFSGFVIYPSNIPTYWKWLMNVNPIHWANVLFCRFQFKGYTEPCSNYLGQLPFCSQNPSMTVGKAYLVFYELSGDAKRPWLPYAILFGWTVIANLLALLGLKKIEFTVTSQSLPHLKKTPGISNFKEDTESEFQSVSSYSTHSDRYSASRSTRPQRSLSANDKMNNNGGVEKWIEEFRIDLERNGLGIPVEPVTLLFEDLSFTRYDEEMKESKSVFKDIKGYARPQNMLALLGGSKTGKATLLKCLAGRVPLSGNLNGNLQENGVKPGATFFRLIGYVEKLDAHQPYLSVRESLQFSAALRLGQAINPMSRRIHVELVLNQLGLLPFSNQLVGSLRDTSGKTFEIAKKITIAVELAANPSILFLEEPISGLDTTGTLTILKILSQVAESGRVIIATLSHPNARSLSSFDQALILTPNNVIPQIGTDRLVYFREKRAGMYLPIFYPVSWAVGEIPYFFVATLAVVGIGNGMAGIGTNSAAEFLTYWLLLFLFTLCVTYFGMMITFLAPVPTLAAFVVSIVTSLWVSASGVVVVLSDIRFYRWMYWSNPFQFAVNAMTSISFYCDAKECKSDCSCPRLPDGSYVWDRLATVRALNYERIDTDVLTLAAMCVLFACLAFLFFVVLKHNSTPRV